MSQHFRPGDLAIFGGAARQYGVIILVRQTNSFSIAYLGKEGYTPKPIDCKAKTADFDGISNGTIYKTAGLVVCAEIEGYGQTCYKSGKSEDALKFWRKMEPVLYDGPMTLEDGSPRMYLPANKRYFVDRDPASIHYGCLKLCQTGLVTAGEYVVGDYDLYDIVDIKNPTENVVFPGQMQGQPHNRGPHLTDVQNYLNSRMGTPGVRHGSQAKFAAEHSDEPLDVFFPNGQHRILRGKAAIEAFYRGELKGRKLFGQS